MNVSPPLPAKRRFCAVVPAAGHGSRLGLDRPKVFLPVQGERTIWDLLHARLAPLVEQIVLVLSPDGRDFVEKNPGNFSKDSFTKITLATQAEPLGMGDAIFGAGDFWRDYDDLIIVWGDQFNLSARTLAAGAARQAQRTGPALTLPVVRTPRPYVEYVFDDAKRLVEVRQSREGDVCRPNGFSDLGLFFLSAGPELWMEWQRYLAGAKRGAQTREINFLPFLAHLSLRAGWPLHRYEAADPAEALGINTPEELKRARQLLESSRGEP